MVAKSPKTVNNVLAVLSVLVKKAVEWDVIDRMPCTIRLLPIPKSATTFHDFDQYEHLVEAAKAVDRVTELIVLLGGEVTAPKGGRLRYVPLTVRLTAALREHRHLRSARVLCQGDGTPLSRQQVQYRVKRVARKANGRRRPRQR
jgi:hypothetical protein